MIVQQPPLSTPLPFSPLTISHPLSSSHTFLVTITKVPKYPLLYAGYTNGTIRIFDTNRQQVKQQHHLFQNGEVIDLQIMDQNIVSCTHTEINVSNLNKNKSISLKGHESTPFFLACHPVSPLVLSCSNILILHDLRLRKPINVNFITPPAYSLQYFPDGQFFVLGGEPCRVGNSQWVRTLLNGLAQPSLNGKHILTNPMNGKISLWDWRESEEIMSWEGIRNQNIYQMPYFGMVEGRTRNALFFDEECVVHNFGILDDSRKDIKLEYVEDSKIFIDKMEPDTREFYRYSTSGLIEKYRLELQ